MGQTFLETNLGDVEIVAGFSKEPVTNLPFSNYTNLEDVEEEIDVIIDFSHYSSLDDLLNFAKSRKLPILIASTGHDGEDQKKMMEASNEIPVFFSQNTSQGVYTVGSVLPDMARKLEDFNLEIIESHHRYKKDSPSGTAFYLFNQLKEGREDLVDVLGRSGTDLDRQKNEVGISAIRGGTVVGEHTVYFLGEDEMVEVTHRALSKKIFVYGALKIAKFLEKAQPGFYVMEDLYEN